MAGIRDPSFWRRFSLAVHRDEEQGRRDGDESPLAGSLKHSDSWLDEQKRKRSRIKLYCWVFWLALFGVVAGIILVLFIMRTNREKQDAAQSKQHSAEQ